MKDLKETLLEINLGAFLNTHYGTKFDLNSHSPMSVCIFHNDKKPSLTYKKESNRVICWTSCYCNTLGVPESTPLDIFNVVSLKESLDCKKDFVEIMKIICRLENIPFQERKLDPRIENMYQYKANVAKRYIDNLRSKENITHQVHTYLEDRGIAKQTAADFFLGLTSSNEDKFGISQRSNMLSIPILNENGDKIFAICCRQIIENSYSPKYKHDKSDEIWKKKETLYGFSHAKKIAREQDEMYIVEGYFDVFSMYQIGLKNTVATMGASMTEEQCVKIKKLVSRVVFILDQDITGDSAFKRSLDACLRHGLSVEVIASLDFLGKDMNDVCIKLEWDAEKIKELLNKNKRDAISHSLHPIVDALENQILNLRKNAYKEVMGLLDKLEDGYEKEVYVNEYKKRIL